MNDANKMSDAGMTTGQGGFCRSHCRGGMGRFLIAALAVFIAWQLLELSGILPSDTFPAADPNNWQAVFLVNENIPFFGHLTEVNKDYVKLDNVYYTQVSQQATSSKAQPQISLVKFGNEIYGPADEMNIPKSQILHWEEMRADSTVVKTIEQYIADAQKAAATQSQSAAQTQAAPSANPLVAPSQK